jgi:probable HAF family extracellular repeat protein
LFSIGLMACFAIGVSTSGAQQRYSVTDLGVVEKMTASEPAAINNQGEIVGTSSAGEKACAFHYLKTMEDIGGLNSRAFGISSTGLMVGDFIRSESLTKFNHAAVLKGGTVVDLGVLAGGLYSRANGVNAEGYVVGYSGSELDSANSRAFVWHGTTGMVDIGTLGGFYAQAMAVNDIGFVTGNAEIASSQVIGARHAFLYQIRKGESPIRPIWDLGTLGGASSYGMAINMKNHVVGYSALNTRDNRVHAFLYTGGKLIDLGSLSPKVRYIDHSVALGINNYDQVVGYGYVREAGIDAVKQAAFLYGPGNTPQNGMVNLNTLIGGAARKYWLFSATAINDRGQIIASAYHGSDSTVHAVVLNPITAGW